MNSGCVKFYVSILLLLCVPLGGFAIGFAPVRNFSRHNYGAGPQNWSVAQDASGRVYFGNSFGMLKYDGARWSLHPLPNYTAVRAVLADRESGRIYAGGHDEFGYFHNDPLTRRLQYVSMASLLPDGHGSVGEVWHIHRLGKETMAFQADYKIILFEGPNVRILTSHDKLIASGTVRGSLYAGTENGKLLCLKGNRLQSLGVLPGTARIVAILPYQEDKLLIVTATAGLYSYDGRSFRQENWDISHFLIENHAFSATYADNVYAFGTVNDGAVVKDLQTGMTDYINKATGLQDNTVLNLGFDLSSNIWLCLDNGVSYALVDSPFFNFLGDSSEAGAGYSSMLRGSTLYLATNRGLFSTPYPPLGGPNPPALHRLHSGQVWSLDSIGTTLFVSADDGLYTIQGSANAPLKLDGIRSGSWFVAPLASHPGKALASTYNGFYLLSYDAGRWHASGKVEGYDDAGGKFVEAPDGSLWISHWLKGVYRLRLSSDLKGFDEVKLYNTADGLPEDRNNAVTMDRGEVRITAADGSFYVVKADGSLERDRRLSSLVPLHQPAHLFPLAGGVSLALSPDLVWKITPDGKKGASIDSISLRQISRSLIPGFEHVGLLADGEILVSHQEGFFAVDLREKKATPWRNGVFVESLVAGDSIMFAGMPYDATLNLEIPYSLNSLTFNFAAPEYRRDAGVLYSFMLEGYDKGWSSPSESPTKEYTRLGEGKYTMRVRALNSVTGETAESAFQFSILPPWYRSMWAWIVYSLLALIILYVAYLWLASYSQRKARKIEEQKEAEMEIMRKEAEKEALRKDYEIAALKSDQLELDIKHKSSELSNTTMNVIRKNEILLDIASMLSKLHEKAREEGKWTPNMKKEVDKIQALIQDNISHDDDWKKFHQNFDIVYADFTKHLTELHPTLTVQEKRLCCYLKMGLSSKEIAPIFSISPKSVEMNRYRLRRKMGLEREDNLVEYLQNI
ncbi:MAG: hypothetical protein J1F07_02230 [Muribaculaceae bacterium]|nr:hypothetical protein [Muribaculaceae bacterium]